MSKPIVYTPTTEDVRNHYARGSNLAHMQEAREGAFDRWLAARDAGRSRQPLPMGSTMRDDKFFTRPIVYLIIGAIVASAALASVITIARNSVHQSSIEACAELDGRINDRDFSCVLPDGRIVEPVRWAEVHGE